MGTLHKGPDQPLSPLSFQLKRLIQVGGYAVQPVWGDGHSAGIFFPTTSSSPPQRPGILTHDGIHGWPRKSQSQGAWIFTGMVIVLFQRLLLRSTCRTSRF